MPTEPIAPPRRILICSDSAEFLARTARAVAPDLELLAVRTGEETTELIERADTLVAPAARITHDLLSQAAGLRWIHALTSGVDNFIGLDALRPEVIVTSSRGAHGPQMSELALLLMLALARGFPKMLANQRNAVWEGWSPPLLQGKSVLLVGVGAISAALAPRCKALGMTVIGASSTVRDVPAFDSIIGWPQLHEALGAADFVVLLLPARPDTIDLVDAAFLRSMKPTAYLINLGRGELVVEEDLKSALREQRIAGAGLDVFRTEPLPADSDWWTIPNLVITPHVGGRSNVYPQQLQPIFEHNLRAMVDGRPERLWNRVRRD